PSCSFMSPLPVRPELDAFPPRRSPDLGDIEGGKVPAAVVQLDEVHHVAVDQAIPEVADGAAKDQTEGHQLPAGGTGQARHPHRQHGAHQHRDGDEEPALPAAGIAQETERGAGVVEQGPVKEGGHRHLFGVVEGIARHPLAELIEHHHQQRQGVPAPHRGDSPVHAIVAHRAVHQAKRRVSPRPSTLSTQRPHRSGCSPWLPTSARKCQQRTHLGSLEVTRPTLSPLRRLGTPPAPSLATRAAEVMVTKRSSSPSLASTPAMAGSAWRLTSACRAPLMVPALRASSITLLTASLTSAISAQSAAPMAASAGSRGSGYHSAVNTVASRSPGMKPQISSAVKLRIGAIQRTKASATWK